MGTIKCHSSRLTIASVRHQEHRKVCSLVQNEQVWIRDVNDWPLTGYSCQSIGAFAYTHTLCTGFTRKKKTNKKCAKWSGKISMLHHINGHLDAMSEWFTAKDHAAASWGSKMICSVVEDEGFKWLTLVRYFKPLSLWLLRLLASKCGLDPISKTCISWFVAC